MTSEGVAGWADWGRVYTKSLITLEVHLSNDHHSASEENVRKKQWRKCGRGGEWETD